MSFDLDEELYWSPKASNFLQRLAGAHKTKRYAVIRNKLKIVLLSFLSMHSKTEKYTNK
jgi:hypothetical protein